MPGGGGAGKKSYNTLYSPLILDFISRKTHFSASYNFFFLLSFFLSLLRGLLEEGAGASAVSLPAAGGSFAPGPRSPREQGEGRCRVSPGERATSLFIIHDSRAACSRATGRKKRPKRPKCPSAFQGGLAGGVTVGVRAGAAGAAGQLPGRRPPRGGDAPPPLNREESSYRQNSSKGTPGNLGLVWFLQEPFFRSICKQKKPTRTV